jgi:hypothetical protein
MNRPPDRHRYAPSGALDPLPFLVCAALTGAVAVLAGYVVYASTPLTFAGALLGPLVAGIPLSGFVAIAVRVGKCRNPAVGAALGFSAGVLILVGAFQFSLAAAKGNDHFFRVDLLPGYVNEHVHDSDAWNPPFAGQPRPPATTEQLAFRWAVLAFGCLTGCVAPVVIGWLMAAKPFSEARRCWFKGWTIRLTRESGAAVAEAISTGQPDALRDAVKVIPPGEKLDPEKGFAHLYVEYLPGEADEPVFASLAVMTAAKGKPPWAQTVFKQWQLTPEEAAALAAAVPIPNAAFGANREGTLPGDRVATPIGVRVVPLPDQDAGLILSSGNLWVATAAGFLPLILGIVVATTAGIAAWQKADDLEPVELGAVIALGVAALVASLAWMTLYADYLPARVLHARARRVVAQRPDAFVYPDDPEAFFVQRIPRQNWARIMLENADELGFMRLDEDRGVILFEGDRERWMIPRESVVSIDLDAFDIGPSDPNVGPAFWLVVLKVNADGRVWECPLAMRVVTLKKATPTTRRREAEDFQSSIRRVLGPE